MIRWREHSQKGVTDGQTDRRTDGQKIPFIELLGRSLKRWDGLRDTHTHTYILRENKHKRIGLIVRSEGNPLVTDGYLSQRCNNTDNIPIIVRNHGCTEPLCRKAIGLTSWPYHMLVIWNWNIRRQWIDLVNEIYAFAIGVYIVLKKETRLANLIILAITMSHFSHWNLVKRTTHVYLCVFKSDNERSDRGIYNLPTETYISLILGVTIITTSD